jgi:hypothetical protein
MTTTVSITGVSWHVDKLGFGLAEYTLKNRTAVKEQFKNISQSKLGTFAENNKDACINFSWISFLF